MVGRSRSPVASVHAEREQRDFKVACSGRVLGKLTPIRRRRQFGEARYRYRSRIRTTSHSPKIASRRCRRQLAGKKRAIVPSVKTNRPAANPARRLSPPRYNRWPAPGWLWREENHDDAQRLYEAGYITYARVPTSPTRVRCGQHGARLYWR